MKIGNALELYGIGDVCQEVVLKIFVKKAIATQPFCAFRYKQLSLLQNNSDTERRSLKFAIAVTLKTHPSTRSALKFDNSTRRNNKWKFDNTNLAALKTN